MVVMSEPTTSDMETELDLLQHLIKLADHDLTIDLSDAWPNWMGVMRAHTRRRIFMKVVKYANSHTLADVKMYVVRSMVASGQSNWRSADPCDEVIARLETQVWAEVGKHLGVGR